MSTTTTSLPPDALPAPSTPGAQPALLLFCLFALYVIWGSTYLGIRWALEGFPPFLLGGLRFTLAGGLLYGVLRLRGHARPEPRQWAAGAGVGVLLLGVGNGGVVFAQQWVPSSMAALVVGSMPLWAALFGGLFGQWPGRAERWGLALGFGGVFLLNLGGELGGHPGATLALLVAPMSWAFGSIWMRRLPMAPGLMGTALQMLTAGCLLLLLGLGLGERMHALPSPRALSAFLYLLFFGSLVAFSAYGYLLRHARPALATSYAYVNPGVAVLLGLLLAGESLSGQALLAMGAILGAVMLLTRRAPPRPASRP